MWIRILENLRVVLKANDVSGSMVYVSVAGAERSNVAIAGYGVINTNNAYDYLVSLKDQKLHYTVFFD